MKEKLQKKHSGFSVKAFTIPLLLLVVFLHISLVLIVIDINHSSNRLFDLMERSGNYQIDATSMQASNTVMSETCSNYIQMPLNGDNSANVGPLITYVNELNSDRRSPKVAARFRNYDVSYEVMFCVEKASEYSEQIKDIQLHAIAVMSSVYPLPAIPALEVFSQVELTTEELAMSDEEKIARARNLITGGNYAPLRYSVAENIDNCNRILQEEFSKTSAKTKQHVNTMRNLLWGEIAVIAVILSGAFAIFYLYIVRPLRVYSKNIAENHSIKNLGKISEMQQLVDSFNKLWDYRNKLEAVLRTEAENDALTGLPNRYCMEHDILKNENNGNSFSVLMFDVNFLKKTNDTQGHLAGDQLLRTAAACIRECFGVDNLNNCYRIGGDEFVALIYGDSEEETKRRIDKFNLALLRENISVSVGYAYTQEADGDSFKKLMADADKNMYDQKKIAHQIKKD